MKRLNKRTQKKENRFQLGPRRLLGESLEQRNLFSTISPAGADLQIVGDDCFNSDCAEVSEERPVGIQPVSNVMVSLARPSAATK